MLKRMDPGRLLAKAFRVLAADPGLFLVIAFLVFSPVLLGKAMMLGADSDTAALVEWGLNLLANLVLTPITAAALVFGVFQRLQGRSASVGGCLRMGFRRGIAVVLASFLVGLATAAGLCMLIIPGIIVASGLFVAVPALVVERESATMALSRSWELTREHRWQMFVLLVVVFILSAGTGALVGYLGPQGLEALGMTAEESLTLADMALSWVLLPLYALQAVLQGVAYYELRAGKEGLGAEDLAAVFD